VISIASLIAAGIEPTQARQVIDPLLQTFDRFEISTVQQRAMFVAQNAHESAMFTRLEENLRWRDAKRLNAMFSAIKSDAEAASLIAKGPEAIANVVYGGRNGNVTTTSGIPTATVIAISSDPWRAVWLKTGHRRPGFVPQSVKPLPANHPKRAAFSRPFAAPRWWVQTSLSRDPAKKVARSIFDALPARHQHPQQRHQAQAI
jgi:hypothetical protein